MTFITYFLISFLLVLCNSLQVAPTWLASQYVKADSARIIDGYAAGHTIGTGTTPTATMPFPGTAFTLIPNLGYGITQYVGSDSLYNEKYEITRTSLTNSAFSVLVVITGSTYLWLLQVRYIAIDSLFPHHLNSFDNVPVQYNNPVGLVNVTTASMSVQTYTNTINYTAQCNSYGYPYNTFNTPLSRNKILLFMTSMFITGNVQSSTNRYPISLQVSAVPISSQQYTLSVKFSQNAYLTRLHYSIIAFDQIDVQLSGKYMLVYERVDFTNNGGSYEFQQQFGGNFIMGLTDLYAIRTYTIVIFKTQYKVLANGKYGIFMPVSTSPSSMYPQVPRRLGFTVFYMKTWQCPTTPVQTFFNPSNNMCEDCPIVNCKNCLNLTVCQQCDTANGFMLDSVTGTCFSCMMPGCKNCTQPGICLQCNEDLNYVLLANGSCQLCDVSLNYFANISAQSCQLCTIDQCLNCSSLTTCQQCNTTVLFYVNPYDLCSFCDPSHNQLINPIDNKCYPCAIQGCTNCSTLSICSVCNETGMYLLNATDNLCYLCTLQNCLKCKSFTECQICDQSTQHFKNSTTLQCQPCTIEGCLNCSSLIECAECDLSNNYGKDFTSVNQTLCGSCNVSCVCDGYYEPWIYEANNITQGQCSTICGDSLIRVNEQCDDNNTDNGDGCNSKCEIQKYWVCADEPSNCTQTLYIQAEFISIQKSGCNEFKITAKSPFLLSQIFNNILIMNQDVVITKLQQNESYIQIHVQYFKDMIDEKIILHFSPGDLLQIPYNPQIPALYHTESQCFGEIQIKKVLTVIQVISYIILFVGLMSCKIVGLELFGVLQLAYFTLGSHNFLNLYLSPLTSFRTFNGLNIKFIQQILNLPKMFLKIDSAATFLNNCNIMLLVMFAQLLISFILYILSRLIKSGKLRTLSLNLLKQGFITFLIFNIFNISFSAGVHFKYSSSQSPFYLLSSILLYVTLAVTLISITLIQLTEQTHYGQYKNKFKPNLMCKLYIPFTLIYRIVLGFYSAVHSQYQDSTLIVLGISMMFMLYIIVNLPFISVYQNYRAGFIHVTMLVTLLVTNYYRSMKSNTPMEIKGKIFSPALIELALILISVGVSAVVLLYEIYVMIKQWKAKQKVDINKRNLTEQSLNQIHQLN